MPMAFVIFLVVLFGVFGLFFFAIKKNMRSDLAHGRVRRGVAGIFPQAVPLIRRRLNLDFADMTPEEACERFVREEISPDEAVDALRQAIDELVGPEAPMEPSDEMLSALWSTLGLVHFHQRNDPDIALACFDVSEALDNGEEWARTDVVDALGRVDDELEIDYEGVPGLNQAGVAASSGAI